LAQFAQQQHDKSNAAKRQLRKERQRVSERLKDRIIPDFLAPGGVEHRIDADPKFAKELVDGEWGAIMGDIRGVKDTNDLFGLPAGDNLLYAAGKRMLQVRRRRGTRHPERRADPKLEDIGFREASSDELGIIVRKTSPEQTNAVLQRIVGLFSVEKAIRDDQAGELPILGTFLSVHASSVQDRIRTETRTSYAARNTFYGVVGAAREQLHQLKNAQYDAMWGRVCEYCISESMPVPEKPADPRAIATLFREHCLPNYNQNQEAMLRNAGPHMAGE
jgi:GGDEF domain-containing protein